jgi:hypothetical protein
MTRGAEPSDPGVDAANEALARLVGQSLSQFAMWGYGLHLNIDTGYQVTVETRLSVTVNGETWEGEPATAGAAAALLKVLHTDVTSAKVVAVGGLQIKTELAVIEVHPHDSYESWQVNGPAHLLIVCMPGGSIAFFPGDGA